MLLPLYLIKLKELFHLLHRLSKATEPSLTTLSKPNLKQTVQGKQLDSESQRHRLKPCGKL